MTRKQCEEIFYVKTIKCLLSNDNTKNLQYEVLPKQFYLTYLYCFNIKLKMLTRKIYFSFSSNVPAFYVDFSEYFTHRHSLSAPIFFT